MGKNMSVDRDPSDRAFSILVVEDQSIILENIRQELEDDSFKVFTAESALEACAVLDDRGRDISAAFLDVDLGPGQDGFDVARYARSLHLRMPVIYTSGGLRGGDACDRVDNSLFVAKPYHPSQIGALLRSLLGPGRAQPGIGPA